MLANGNTHTNVTPDVLEMVGYRHYSEDKGGVPLMGGNRKYARILIRSRCLQQPNLLHFLDLIHSCQTRRER